MSIDVRLHQFEGPLALLLYLIRKDEMDIFDIDIYQITTQYLEYIRRMKELDLETAGDFIAMAATLIQIKSQMLLPQYNAEGDVVEIEDPRKELVSRLLEYQRYQDVSKKLYALPLLGRDLWARGSREELPENEADGEILIEEGGLFALISHYRRAIKNIKKTVHHVAQKTKSIAAQIMQIKDRLIVGQRVVLSDLISKAEHYRDELLITFLTTLELGKMGFVSVYQADTYGDIYLTARKPIDDNVFEHVQEYDSAAAASVADSIFEEAEQDAEVAASPQLELSATAAEEEPEMEAATDDEITAAERDFDGGLS